MGAETWDQEITYLMTISKAKPWDSADTVQRLPVPLSAKWPTVRIMQHHQEMAQCWVCRQGQRVQRYLFTFRCNWYTQAATMAERQLTCCYALRQILSTVMSDTVLVRKLYVHLEGNLHYKWYNRLLFPLFCSFLHPPCRLYSLI